MFFEIFCQLNPRRCIQILNVVDQFFDVSFELSKCIVLNKGKFTTETKSYNVRIRFSVCLSLLLLSHVKKDKNICTKLSATVRTKKEVTPELLANTI